MTDLLDLSWRAYPATLLALLGVAAVWRGIRHVRAAWRASDPDRVWYLARGFRAVITGLAGIGLAVGWCWQIGALVGLSLIIGGEELLETSVVIAALRDQRRRRPRRLGLRTVD